MKRNVLVALGDRSYDVSIGDSIFEEEILKIGALGEVVVITDETVQKQPWFVSWRAFLEKESEKCLCMTVSAGEQSKSLETFSQLCSQLAQANMSRSCTVMAIGGGVVGDLAGFVAASYLRGVRFVQVPTTLLAAVDSSVGGKTGVNLPEGKNLVGAFYQPHQVIVDLSVLSTLSDRQFSAGMAEVIKYGIIWDEAFFKEVESGAPENKGDMIARCVEIKAQVVKEDEKETNGLRAILNFGHTIGHAIEQSVGYGKLLHGEAISIGMRAAAYLSCQCVGLKEEEMKRIVQALTASSLPVHYPDLKYETLAPALARDKKVVGNTIRWVLTPQIGKTVIHTEVSEDLVRETLKYCSQ